MDNYTGYRKICLSQMLTWRAFYFLYACIVQTQQRLDGILNQSYKDN